MHDSDHEQVTRGARTKGTKRKRNETRARMDKHDQQVGQMLEGNEGHREIINMISETGDEEHGMQCFKVLLQKEV